MSTFANFTELYCAPNDSVVALDLSCMNFPPVFFGSMEPKMQAAFRAMAELEGGAIANPDEKRMVGHYWLRNHDLIPDAALRAQVKADFESLRKLIDDIHSRRITAENGLPFRRLLSIGIGGSALGPEFVADALGKDAHDRLTPYFLDNTDPEGIARVLAQLDGKLGETLVLVISKSGGTPETRNGMLLAEAAWKAARLNFGRAAIAITGTGSALYNYAQKNNWLAMLPMYDWVGGRTSVMSQVGLLPAGLQGVDIESFLTGAAEMDALTRVPVTRENPAAMLALAWFHGTKGRGDKDMVILPYKDRLILFSRYLQQLIMESLGKECDLDGNVVHQGIAVYGNKGSTDQHAYIQQLRDGTNNFFAVFVEVLRDGGAASFEVEPGVTAGDYLSGFFQGTRQALRESGRMSLTLTVDEVNARTVGALIALFERAVGLYATLVNINAYHQPGVEAGKKAAAGVLADQAKLLREIHNAASPRTAADVAAAAGVDAERAFRILQHLAANKRGVAMSGRHPSTATFAAA